MNKFGFVFLNIALSSNILKYPCFYLILLIVSMEHPYLFKFFPDNFFFSALILFGIPLSVLVSYILFKIFIFIILYKKTEKDSHLYKFFERFKNDDDFQESILIKAMFSDVIFFTLEALVLYLINLKFNSLYSKTFLDFIGATALVCTLCGTGVFLSYFSLNVWLNKNNKKILKNELSTQAKPTL